MQLDKFFHAQEIRREIAMMNEVSSIMDEKTLVDVRFLEKLPVNLRETILQKGMEAMKKELTKIIRAKEKEFSDL